MTDEHSYKAGEWVAVLALAIILVLVTFVAVLLLR